jgi:hypothetical protein
MPTQIANELIINGYREFYSFLKQNDLVSLDTRIKCFVELMDVIPRLCCCVHSFMYNDARDMFGRNLPLIQADNVVFFDKMKEAAKVSTLIFKEDNNILLQV